LANKHSARLLGYQAAKFGVRQMDVSSRVPAKGNHGLEVLWEDGERVFYRERILNRDGELKNVLLVRLASEHQAPASVDRIAHEYALRDDLDEAWAVRPLRLVREHGRTSLMLEDPDSKPPDRLLGTPMETGVFERKPYQVTLSLA
jgi:hypothetical protein